MPSLGLTSLGTLCHCLQRWGRGRAWRTSPFIEGAEGAWAGFSHLKRDLSRNPSSILCQFPHHKPGAVSTKQRGWRWPWEHPGGHLVPAPVPRTRREPATPGSGIPSRRGQGIDFTPTGLILSEHLSVLLGFHFSRCSHALKLCAVHPTPACWVPLSSPPEAAAGCRCWGAQDAKFGQGWSARAHRGSRHSLLLQTSAPHFSTRLLQRQLPRKSIIRINLCLHKARQSQVIKQQVTAKK